MFQNLSAPQRLSESSFVLNDSARWGRQDVAQGHVDPSYLAQYAHRHQQWGHQIQIAEADIVSMQVDEGKEGATSVVQMAWYSTDTMSLHASTITQRWAADGQNFLLVSEDIEGDPRLFTADPEDGGDEAAEPEPEPESVGQVKASAPSQPGSHGDGGYIQR